MKKPKNVDEYIAQFPRAAQRMLTQIRGAIQSSAPDAEEKLSYGMPYYGYHGRLAYFAGFSDHVSYFVMPSGQVQKIFAKELKPYKTGKATLQFPIGTKVPAALIKKLVKARARENLQKHE